MEIKDFVEELKKIGVKVNEKNLKDLVTYKNILIEYNQKFNLTAIKTDKEIYLKHFYDSLTLVKAINLNEELNVLDIGTGAGFPGIVLKIIFPNLKLTLLDANNKKILFLNEVIKELKLENVECIHGRAEELNAELRESFDLVTSRAVANLRILTELAIPYVKVNGYFIAMKGNAKPEIEEAKTTIAKLNAEITSVTEFMLPVEDSVRSIVKIKKIDVTPSIYPRKYDTILKKILK